MAVNTKSKAAAESRDAWYDGCMIRRAGERSRLSHQGMTRMKPAVQQMLNRRRFFQSVGTVAAGATAASVGRNGGGASRRPPRHWCSPTSNASSEPSALKITDLRYAVIVNAPMTCPIIRIDTNQGISGYGEVRDGHSETYALVPQEPHPRREPLQRRQNLPEDQAVRRPGPAGGRRLRHRDGVHGSGGQGLGRALLADAGRQVPRPRTAVCGHDARRRSEAAGRAA